MNINIKHNNQDKKKSVGRIRQVTNRDQGVRLLRFTKYYNVKCT